MKSLALLLTVLAIGSVRCNLSSLEQKYQGLLAGKEPLSYLVVSDLYSAYARAQGKEPSTYRFQLFYETLEEIQLHNLGTHSWKKGLTPFTDLSFGEFQEAHLMAPQECSATAGLRLKASARAPAVPAAYEWNDYGLVTAVKNQGSCGSCWAFSTVGCLESHWNILGLGRNLTFSEQQLVDCAHDFDNNGCNGGLPSHAFEYIRYAGGIESDITYPYKAKTLDCVFRPNIAVGYVRHGSYNITQGDEVELAERLYSAGPISLAYQVIAGFKDYKSGVYSVANCGKTTQEVNHAVLATGYGVEGGKNYWNVKNSWGDSWGNAGYFKIERGVNMCAVAQCNSYPLVNNVHDYESVEA